MIELHQHKLRYLLAAMAFMMALVLTPRAFVDGDRHARTTEVPVRVLEQPDNCLWCTPPQPAKPVHCDELDQDPSIWLNPDSFLPEDIATPCIEDEHSTAPSA